MFCNKCGTQIPDDANFCFKCGAPQVGQPEWEICKIQCVELEPKGWLQTRQYQFQARVTGPQGPYSVANSPILSGVIIDIDNKKVKAAFDAVVNNLLKDGWEYVSAEGEFLSWWKHQLRRRKN